MTGDSDIGDGRSAVRQVDREEAAILQRPALRPIPPGTTTRSTSLLGAREKACEWLPHRVQFSKEVGETMTAASAFRGGAYSDGLCFWRW